MSITDKGQHALKLAKIQAQLAYFKKHKQQFRIYHGSSNTTRNNQKDPSKTVDVSELTSVLEINTSQQYAWVEANVSMGALVDATLALGYVPQVVPEFPAITVGGAIQGVAGESSSFKYGCVHNTCIEYELLLADGSLAVATDKNQPELFRSVPGSYGSIAIITAAKVRLIPAEPYVRVRYQKVTSYKSMIKQLASKVSADFVDGIMFSRVAGVAITGVFSNKRDSNHSTFHRFRDDWFYTHVQRKLQSRQTYEETLPTKDYLFRYDRGAFWMAKYGFEMFHTPFNRLTRLVSAGLLKTEYLYSFWEQANISQGYLIQDICLPQQSVEVFLKYNEAQLGIFPLWLCPLKPDRDAYLSPTYVKGTMLVNVGIWGKLSQNYNEAVDGNRQLEAKVHDLGGRKVLYAHAYYTKAEFWDIYAKKRYDKARAQAGAVTSLPDIYSKVYVGERYNRTVVKGIASLIKASLFR